jgi:hypothetical protein
MYSSISIETLIGFKKILLGVCPKGKRFKWRAKIYYLHLCTIIQKKNQISNKRIELLVSVMG